MFGPGVTGGELPARGPLIGVDADLPVAEFAVQFFNVSDPAGEALARECGELDCGDIEPESVLGRVVASRLECFVIKGGSG